MLIVTVKEEKLEPVIRPAIEATLGKKVGEGSLLTAVSSSKINVFIYAYADVTTNDEIDLVHAALIGREGVVSVAGKTHRSLLSPQVRREMIKAGAKNVPSPFVVSTAAHETKDIEALFKAFEALGAQEIGYNPNMKWFMFVAQPAILSAVSQIPLVTHVAIREPFQVDVDYDALKKEIG